MNRIESTKLNKRHYLPIRLMTVVCALLVISTFLAPPAHSGNESTSTKIATTQSQIKALKSDIKEMKKLLRGLARKRSKSTQALETLDRDISELHIDLEKQKTALTKSEAELEALVAEGVALANLKQEAKSALTTQIRSRYQSPSGTSQIKLLFQEENPRLIDRQLNYHRYILESQDKQISKFNQLLIDIEANQRQVRQTKESLEQRKLELETKIGKLNETLGKRKRLLSKIKQQERSNNKKLTGLKEEQKELGAVLELLKLQAAREALNANNFKSKKGKLQWPVAIQRKSGKSYKRDKKGITIPTKPLSPVKAVFGGKVVFADWLRGYGWLIIIQHQGEYLSLYAHNASLNKEVGDKVESGELIARSGNSGQTEKSQSYTTDAGNRHQGTAQLYFEMRKDGKAIDPTKWLVKKG